MASATTVDSRLTFAHSRRATTRERAAQRAQVMIRPSDTRVAITKSASAGLLRLKTARRRVRRPLSIGRSVPGGGDASGGGLLERYPCPTATRVAHAPCGDCPPAHLALTCLVFRAVAARPDNPDRPRASQTPHPWPESGAVWHWILPRCQRVRALSAPAAPPVDRRQRRHGFSRQCRHSRLPADASLAPTVTADFRCRCSATAAR